MADEIMVSIVCNAYNHEKYITQALNSFLMQKTNFPFEVLIHDDASTDGTADIIRDYVAKFPEIIKPIYQTQNQYSQKISVTRTYQYSRAQGKYIALCEGDDYWTDPCKLQKQVDAMEAHPEVDICAHRTAYIREGKVTALVPKQKSSTIFPPEQVIAGGGAFVATSSLMFRRNMLNGENDYTQFWGLDYILQISGSLRGGMLYLKDCMSVYRQMSEGSWTARTKSNIEKRKAHSARIKDVLSKIDAGTDHRYTAVINNSIALSSLKTMAQQGDVKTILSPEYRRMLGRLSFVLQCEIVLFAAFKAVTKRK